MSIDFKDCLIITIVFICCSIKVQAQLHLYDQYITNNYLINPAVTGIEKYIEVQAGYRSQWNAVEGGPTTMFVSSHGSLTKRGRKIGFTEMPVEDRNINHNLKNFNYKSHHGVGGMLSQENIGPFSGTEALGSYAFHKPMSKKWLFAMGVGVGAKFYSLQTDKVSTGVLSDPLVDGFSTQTTYLLRLGVWVYSKKLFFGLSQHNNFSNRFPDDGKAYFASAGINLKNYYGTWTFTPFAMLRLYGSERMTEIGMKFYHNQRLWFGSTYRNTKALTFFGGINLSPWVSISCAFNSQFNERPISTLGTTEIGVQMRLNNKQKVLCPQHFW